MGRQIGRRSSVKFAMERIETFLEKIKNKKLLAVFPHPDDESVMAGGLIQRAMKLGFEVTVLTITEGNMGKIHINGKGRSVSEIRREEMALAMSRLGVADWIMWKFDDGKLRKTKRWRERLENFLRQNKYGVIVSYDLSGVSGHPDHIDLSREIIGYVRKNKPVELIWPSFLGKMREKVADKRTERYLSKPEFLLEMNFWESVKKWRAAFAHRSQSLQGFMGWSWWILSFVEKRECFARFDRNKKYKFRFVKFKI